MSMAKIDSGCTFTASGKRRLFPDRLLTVWAAHVNAAVTHPSDVRPRRLALEDMSFADLLDPEGDVYDLCSTAIATGLVPASIGNHHSEDWKVPAQPAG